MPKAVNLSYAAQDAEAALRLCSGLRGAGVEVWFDQSELVGGEAWDAGFARGFEFWVWSLGLSATEVNAA